MNPKVRLKSFSTARGFAEGGERGIHGLIIEAKLRRCITCVALRHIHRSFASLEMTELETDHVHRSRSLHEAQRRGVHAVAEMGGFRAIVEDVAEVGVAFGAGNRGADHAESRVTDLGYVFFGDGRPEAGPSGTGVEFCGGVEERIVAADATVDAFVVKVPVFPGKGDFSVGVAGDVEDSSDELLAPLIRRLDDLGDANLFQAVSGVGERDDCDVCWFRECSGRSIQYSGTDAIAKLQGPQWLRSKLRGTRDVAYWVAWQQSFARRGQPVAAVLT